MRPWFLSPPNSLFMSSPECIDPIQLVLSKATPQVIEIVPMQLKKKEDKMKKVAFIMVVFASLVFCPSDGQSLEVGDNAPDFSLVDVSGKEITLSEFKGNKNVVLVFYSEHK
jgi:hypothetical protein